MRTEFTQKSQRSFGRWVSRTIDAVSRTLPVCGIAALVLAVLAGVNESDSVSILDFIVRLILFVLACFVGSYMPMEGQADVPSLLTATAMSLALLTSLGGVALAILKVFANELSVGIAMIRRRRVVVVGRSETADALARRVRASGAPVVTIGTHAEANIRVGTLNRLVQHRRVRHVVGGADTVYVADAASVDNAIVAADLRGVVRRGRVFQMYDWEMDRLVFRDAVTRTVLPAHEVFAPAEVVAIHIAQVIAQVVRQRSVPTAVRVCGVHPALAILRERLEFMLGALSFRGGLRLVESDIDVCSLDDDDEADVIVAAVSQKDYVPAMEAASRGGRTVIMIAPERYFAAVGRSDLDVVPSRDWFVEARQAGSAAWRGRRIVVDEERVGVDIDEITLGVRDRWAREFHNAHSDFSSARLTNRWLDMPPHPRLVRMARAAVDLMLRDLAQVGFSLVVRDGDHDTFTEDEIERCARHIHDQYLELEWDDGGTLRRCAEYFVDERGLLVPTDPPPAWEDGGEPARERNREMVRKVYPALAATFGYRLTRERDGGTRSRRHEG